MEKSLGGLGLKNGVKRITMSAVLISLVRHTAAIKEHIMKFFNQSIALIFTCVFFLHTNAGFTETLPVEGVEVVIKSPPKKRIHCEVYSSTVTAKFNNPPVEKEIKDTDAAWNLSDQAEFSENADTPYTLVAKDSGYRIFYQPNWVSKTLSPKWTIFESERITKTQSGGEISVGTNDVYHDDCKRGSFFSTPGQWKMTFTASLTVPNKTDSNIVYTSEGTESFRVEIEGTKILVHSFEGAGAALGLSEDSIKNALGQTLNNDKRIDWTRHTWAGVSGAVSDICDKHSACLGCGHYDTVVLVGHSYGGHAAMKCVEELHDETVQMWDKTENFCLSAALVFTIDPVKHLILPPRPDQVGDWGFSKDTRITGSHINYYQRCDVSSYQGIIVGPKAIWGDIVSGADNNNQEVSQDRFDNSGKSHINIVQTVAGEFAAALQNVPTQQSSPGISPDHQ